MKKLKKKIICLIFAIVFSFCLAISSFQVFRNLNEYREGVNFYSDLDISVKLDKTNENSSEMVNNNTQPLSETESIDLPKVDFDALYNINSDIIGWIYFEGTNIDYPIVRSDDNEYYLDHMFNGELNSSGSIFLDSENNDNFSDRNNILYGHHMKNGTMFSKITNYDDQSYYDEHMEAFLLTPEKNYRIKLFSGYVANQKDEAWRINFQNDEDFTNWIHRTIDKSCFKSDFLPKSTDSIITFSTCSYEFSNARFVLHGVLSDL